MHRALAPASLATPPASADDTKSADDSAAAIVHFLRAAGAARQPHAGGRTLLDHLVGTCSILRRWGQPEWLQHAALIHSIYGTESYQCQLLSPESRDEVAAVAGVRAERLAYLFCVTPRRPLFVGTHRWARDLPTRPTSHGTSGDPPTRDELDALVLLHMANLAEQTRAPDRSPGVWLVRVRDLAELLIDSDSLTPPAFAPQLDAFDAEAESLTRRSYLEAMSADDEAHATGFALAAAACPVVPEPCVWLAHLSRCRRDAASSKAWTEQARRRLSALGTPWDKRLSYEEWDQLIDALERSADGEPRRASHPRELFEAVVRPGAAARSAAKITEGGVAAPHPEAGRRRFHRYVEGLSHTDESRPGAIYPDLPSRPWHDPCAFSLVGYLESHFEAIRNEILALDATVFHRESERISRTGDWDVAFLYERGRRHDDVCAACPVTARGIETHPTVRTLAGLIYVSRMRAGTHIAAHRGPTNLRVRCHLAIEVPEGDCAIRVGEQTRRWREGECLVFDDFFEHEAWNHTDEERIVLIVDLWHPGLSDTEVALLEALHDYTSVHARRLNRYWAANAQAARRSITESPAGS